MMVDDVNMTLSHIRAMLWIYYNPRPLPKDDDICQSKIIADLLLLDLIEPTEESGRYSATAKARPYVEAIRSIPLPVQIWVIPS